MSEYKHQEVYNRIRAAWESIGCKSAHEFSEYAKSQDITISEATISNWKNSHNVPEISSLMDICNLCGCDIDFLLGKIPCMTHEVTTVQEQTGLSEEAINKLIDCDELYELAPRFSDESEEKFKKFVSREKHSLINFISFMISHKDFLPLMYKIVTISEDWKASRSSSAKVMGLISGDAVKALRMNPHRTAREDELLLDLYDVETLTTDFIEQIVQDFSDSSEIK